MHRSFLLSFFLLASAGCVGQAGGLTTVRPAVTPRGAPQGAATSASIGPEGGSLASGDGLLTVRVPAGALTEVATLSVQPIRSEAPGAVGRAFRLGPEGATFAAPVEVVFRVPEELVEGTARELIEVAFQDHEGHWQYHRDVERDDAAQTVVARTTHFSDWSLLSGFQLRPAKARVRTGGRLRFEVAHCEQVDVPTADGKAVLTSLAAECTSYADSGAYVASRWAVNGVEGGSTEAGQIDEVQWNVADYLAPGSVSGPTVVAISAERLLLAKRTVLLVSHVEVTEAQGWSGWVELRATRVRNEESTTERIYTRREEVIEGGGRYEVVGALPSKSSSLKILKGTGAFHSVSDSVWVSTEPRVNCTQREESHTHSVFDAPSMGPGDSVGELWVPNDKLFQLKLNHSGASFEGKTHWTRTGSGCRPYHEETTNTVKDGTPGMSWTERGEQPSNRPLRLQGAAAWTEDQIYTHTHESYSARWDLTYLE